MRTQNPWDVDAIDDAVATAVVETPPEEEHEWAGYPIDLILDETV